MAGRIGTTIAGLRKVLHKIAQEVVHGAETGVTSRRDVGSDFPRKSLPSIRYSQLRAYMSRRPSMALSMVISSVYSMSLPTGIPMAMRVTFTPARLSCCER